MQNLNNYTCLIEQTKEVILSTEFKNPSLYSTWNKVLKSGISEKYFQIFRDNYLYRTKWTLPWLQHVSLNATLLERHDIAQKLSPIIHDEIGGKGLSHPVLMKNFFDTYEKALQFDSQYVLDEQELLPSVKLFRKAQKFALKKSLPYQIGWTWAHELLADSMMHNLPGNLHRYYGGYMTKKQNKVAEVYLLSHHDDTKENGLVEQEHGRLMTELTDIICFTGQEAGYRYNTLEACEGAIDFCKAQASLFLDIEDALEKVEVSGKKVLFPIQNT